MMRRVVIIAIAAASLIALASHASLGNPQTKSQGMLDYSSTELAQIQSHGPWPLPTANDPGNRLSGSPQAIALGQALFFDARLSTNGRVSCASCHRPDRAFSDGRARALGRVEVDRNTPSLWNAVHERWYGWGGETDSIWSQSIRAMTDPREMASNAAHIARVIAGDRELACRWQSVLGTTPGDDVQRTMVDTAKLISAFTASLVSRRTPFDQFRDAVAQGDTQRATLYPLDAQRGLKLFVGRGQCTVCHVGPMFSNGEFGDIGMKFLLPKRGVDPGRHRGVTELQANAFNLLSKWADAPTEPSTAKTRYIAIQHRNFGEFKVPSLRNVVDTAPYMHDGQLATLSAVIEHYSKMNPERLHADGEQILKPLNLSDGERRDLAAFLRSLSDPDTRKWKPASMPKCATETSRSR
jgi:cytochrome c peroxidase